MAFGLAALLRTVPLAYDALRYTGAAYLCYFGARILLNRSASLAKPRAQPATLASIFWQGAATNVLNPKVALFFLAFLPQFIDRKNGAVAAATIALGLVFDLGGTLVNVALALAVSYVGDKFRAKYLAARWFNWLTGGVFLALGFRLALARHPTAD